MGESSDDIDIRDFRKIARSYIDDPTIENYVRLRRKYPGMHLDVATDPGIEFVFEQGKELEAAYGIRTKAVLGALDGDPKAHGDLALRLLELLLERREMKRKGETHLVRRNRGISDTLVNDLIGLSLDSLAWNGNTAISPDLIVLIKHQLGARFSEYEAKEEKQRKKFDAVRFAVQLALEGKVPSYRKIARIMGVEATTVMRWFEGEDMIAEAKSLSVDLKNMRVAAKRTGVADE
jgi:hypothetical protein